jgi:hypothetical protein
MARRSKRSPRKSGKRSKRRSPKKSGKRSKRRSPRKSGKRSKRRSPKKSGKRSKRRSPRKSGKRSKRRSPRRKSPKKSRGKKSKRYGLLAYYTKETKLSNSNNITVVRQQGGTDNGKEWYVDAVVETPEHGKVIMGWLKLNPGFKRIAELHLA